MIGDLQNRTISSMPEKADYFFSFLKKKPKNHGYLEDRRVTDIFYTTQT